MVITARDGAPCRDSTRAVLSAVLTWCACTPPRITSVLAGALQYQYLHPHQLFRNQTCDLGRRHCALFFPCCQLIPTDASTDRLAYCFRTFRFGGVTYHLVAIVAFQNDHYYVNASINGRCMSIDALRPTMKTLSSLFEDVSAVTTCLWKPNTRTIELHRNTCHMLDPFIRVRHQEPFKESPASMADDEQVLDEQSPCARRDQPTQQVQADGSTADRLRGPPQASSSVHGGDSQPSTTLSVRRHNPRSRLVAIGPTPHRPKLPRKSSSKPLKKPNSPCSQRARPRPGNTSDGRRVDMRFSGAGTLQYT